MNYVCNIRTVVVRKGKKCNFVQIIRKKKNCRDKTYAQSVTLAWRETERSDKVKKTKKKKWKKKNVVVVLPSDSHTVQVFQSFQKKFNFIKWKYLVSANLLWLFRHDTLCKVNRKTPWKNYLYFSIEFISLIWSFVRSFVRFAQCYVYVWLSVWNLYRDRQIRKNEEKNTLKIHFHKVSGKSVAVRCYGTDQNCVVSLRFSCVCLCLCLCMHESSVVFLLLLLIKKIFHFSFFSLHIHVPYCIFVYELVLISCMETI